MSSRLEDRRLDADPRLPWLHARGRNPVLVGGAGLGVLTASFLAARYLGAHSWIGLNGSMAAFVIVAVGLATGRWTGLLVGLVAGMLFLPLVAFATPPNPILFGVPLVVLWSVLGFLAGYVIDRLRSDVTEAYDRQLAITAALQSALAPATLPIVPGVQAARLFRLAGDGHELGGDFYDLFSTDTPGECGFFVGDVCGKGAQAAALTVLARHTLRTCLVLGHSPFESLAELNRAILRRTAGDRFVTAIAGTAQANQSTLWVTLCLAGHPEPLILRHDGLVETVGHLGTLLGVLPEISIMSTSFTLAEGDTLVLFTDGATDIRGDQGRLGVDAFHAIVSAAPRNPDELLRAIARALDAYSTTSLADDVVVLALTPAPSTRKRAASKPRPNGNERDVATATKQRPG